MKNIEKTKRRAIHSVSALCAAVLAAGLVSCGGGSSSPEVAQVDLNGAVQKGPFAIGSAVSARRIDGQGAAVGAAIQGQITDSTGSFTIRGVSGDPLRIEAQGRFFSELTGSMSESSLLLTALFRPSPSSRSASVNILTHLSAARATWLLQHGVDFDRALSQAQSELVAALQDAVPAHGVFEFAHLNLYDVDSAQHDGNAYLLAVSTAFYKLAESRALWANDGTSADGKLFGVLDEASLDFADDGKLEPALLDQLRSALHKVSPARVVANLQARSRESGGPVLQVPDILPFFSLCGDSATCAWSAWAQLPSPTVGGQAVMVDGVVYYIGGDSLSAALPQYPIPYPVDAFTATYAYDVSSNEWSARSPLPTGLYVLTAHEVNGRILVFGGYGTGSDGSAGFQRTVLEYDPKMDRWSAKAPPSTWRYAFASAVIEGKVYVIGGTGLTGNVQGAPWERKREVAVYDAAADRWTNGPDLPMPLEESAACAWGSRVFVFGGWTGDFNPSPAPDASNSVLNTLTYVLDTSAGTWGVVAGMPHPRFGASCVTVGDEIYVLGGAASDGGRRDTVQVFSPRTATWRETSPMPVQRYRGTVASIGDGRVLLMGGRDEYEQYTDTNTLLDTALLN